MGSPGAGALWAGVGDMALKAGQQIQNLPQEMAQNKSAMEGMDLYNRFANLPGGRGYMLMGRDASGRVTIMPPGYISDATTLGAFQEALGIPFGVKPKPATATTPKEGTGEGESKKENQAPKAPTYEQAVTPTASVTQPPAAPGAINQGAINAALAQNLVPSAGGTTGQLSASAAPGPIPAQQPPAAPSGPGAPQGTFLNPATGSYEPLQQGPPPAPSQPPPPAQPPRPQTAQQAGPVWNPAQAAPVRPTQQPQPQAPMTPSPQDMANWQAQNAHPVADSQSALDWAKRFHTGYKTATYLAQGGPGGEPAYNFSDGKSSNIVPLSQMVKNGFGPSVVAQSTSSMLSTTDQAQQQQQGPQGPGLPFGPVSPAQQSGPLPPSPQAIGAAQQQANQFAATGGAPPAGVPPAQPPPGQPAAPPPAPGSTIPSQFAAPTQMTPSPQQIAATQPGQQAPLAPGAYDAAAYQMPQGPTVTQTGEVNPALMAQVANQAGNRPTDTRTASTLPAAPNVSNADMDRIQATADQRKNTIKEGDDDPILDTPNSPLVWRYDNDPKSKWFGRAYTELPPDPGQPFNPLRWYKGQPTYRPVELTQSEMQRGMQYWIDRGSIDEKTVKGMKEAEMAPWLRTKWELQNLKTSAPETGTNNILDAARELAKTNQRIMDRVQTLGENGLSRLNELDRTGAAFGRFEQSMGGSSEDKQSDNMIHELEQDIGHAQDIVRTYPNLLLTPGTSAGVKSSAVATAVGTLPAMGTGESNQWWDAFSGQGYKKTLQTLSDYQKQVVARYGELTRDSTLSQLVTMPRHKENVAALNAGGTLPDPANRYGRHMYTIDPSDYNNFAWWHPQTKYIASFPDGSTRVGTTPNRRTYPLEINRAAGQ